MSITLESLHENGYVDCHNILFEASKKGDEEMVTKILALSPVHLPKIYGEPLMEACRNDHLYVAALLLQDSRVYSDVKNYVFRWVCKNGHSELASLFLRDPSVDPTVNDNSIFQGACKDGRDKVVNILLHDPRVDPTALNNLAFRLACKQGHAEVVALLLQDPRMDQMARDINNFHLACMYDHVKVITLLVKNSKIDPRLLGNYAHRSVAKNGHTDISKLIFDHLVKRQEEKKKEEEEKKKEEEDEIGREKVTNPEKEPVAIVVIRKAMSKNSSKVIINLLQKHKAELTPILDEIVDWALEKEETEILELLFQ